MQPCLHSHDRHVDQWRPNKTRVTEGETMHASSNQNSFGLSKVKCIWYVLGNDVTDFVGSGRDIDYCYYVKYFYSVELLLRCTHVLSMGYRHLKPHSNEYVFLYLPVCLALSVSLSPMSLSLCLSNCLSVYNIYYMIHGLHQRCSSIFKTSRLIRFCSWRLSTQTYHVSIFCKCFVQTTAIILVFPDALAGCNIASPGNELIKGEFIRIGYNGIVIYTFQLITHTQVFITFIIYDQF